MLFQSPIWLWGLLLWAAMAVYLLIGRGRPAVVPFLRFWKGSVITSHQRSWRIPPIFVLLMLTALLLAILAAAEPVYSGRAAVDVDITIILDCGSTMSRPGNGGLFRGILDNAARELGPVNGKVSIISVPGRRVETTGENWVTTATHMLPTAIPVDLEPVVVRQLHQTRGLVVVLSDQPLQISNQRLIQIVPEPPKPEVAITLLAARSQPRAQVMVRLENHSDWKTLHLAVTSEGAKTERDIVLGPVGMTQNEFFDLPGLGQNITAEIDPELPRDPWGKAFLLRQSTGVHLSVLGAVPASVAHMAKVYSKDRPAGTDAREIFISDQRLNEDQAGMWVESFARSEIAAEAAALPHVITQNVMAWPTAGKHGTVPSGFMPVVSLGADPIVAVRENPVRQVWIRAVFTDWEKTPDFVIFFANALDWITDANQSYSSMAPTILGTDWKPMDPFPQVAVGAWPGVYRSQAGRLVAVNAGAYPSIPSAGSVDSKIRASAKVRSSVSLLPAVIYCALGCALGAVFFWPIWRE